MKLLEFIFNLFVFDSKRITDRHTAKNLYCVVLVVLRLAEEGAAARDDGMAPESRVSRRAVALETALHCTAPHRTERRWPAA